MNTRSIPSIRPPTARYAASRNMPNHVRMDKKTPGTKDNTSGSSNEGQALHTVELLRTAITSVELDPETLEKTLSARSLRPSPPLNKRLVALAVALFLLIIILDLIVEHLW